MLLFRCEYGSRAMGLATDSSDHDFMEVHLEPREFITGLGNWKTKHHSTSEGRSGPGDTDTTVYGLRHWAALAAKGNPTALTPLFAPNVEASPRGIRIIDSAGMFISKHAGRQYRGYAHGQRQALLGMRNKKTNRPELVHSHGYDTKFAYHAIRTLIQGVELVRYGWIALPIPERQASFLRDIRTGRVPKGEFLLQFDWWDQAMDRALQDSPLPDTADYFSINRLLHDTYIGGWSEWIDKTNW